MKRRNGNGYSWALILAFIIVLAAMVNYRAQHSEEEEYRKMLPLPANLSQIPMDDDFYRSYDMRPGLSVVVHVLSPEDIKKLGSRYNQPDALGMAIKRGKFWHLYVPPMMCDPGDWVWCHEFRHAQEGAWHD